MLEWKSHLHVTERVERLDLAPWPWTAAEVKLEDDDIWSAWLIDESGFENSADLGRYVTQESACEAVGEVVDALIDEHILLIGTDELGASVVLHLEITAHCTKTEEPVRDIPMS